MITYRRAEPNDAENLLLYTKTVGGETDFLSFGEHSFNISVERQARFISKFQNDKVGVMLVALDGEKIVANASIERNRVGRYNHRAELSINVLRNYWGRGVGTRLMEMLLAFAKETGIKVLYLDVRADNKRAISLYRKFGFESIGRFPKYFLINEEYFDAEFMVLELLEK